MTAICLVTLGTPSGIKAQGILNPLVPVGRFRLGIHTLLQVADSRFGERLEGGVLIREEEPLGLDFSDDAIGSRIFPTLEALEENLKHFFSIKHSKPSVVKKSGVDTTTNTR